MATFGEITTGDASFPCDGDRALAVKVTCPGAGTLTKLRARLGSDTTAGGNCKLMLFSDAGTDPGNRLATTAPIVMPAGGGLIESTCSYSLTAGDYWLVIVGDSNAWNGNIVSDAVGGTSVMANGNFSYDTPPSAWPTTSANYTLKLKIEAEYTPSGGGGGSPISKAVSFGFDFI